MLEHDFKVPHLLVEPIIPWGGIVMLHGPYESGKSLFALTLAKAVAGGGFFLSEYRCRQGVVGMIQADMPDKLYQERQRLARGETEALPIFHVTTDASPFNILRPGKWKKDLEALAAQKPALIVVDTLRKVHQLDENDTNAASCVYGAFRQVFPHATLLFLHHDRKVPTSVFTSSRALEEQFRGSTAWIADLDTGLHLLREKSGSIDDWRAKLTFSKLRTCKEQPPVVLKMSPELLLEVADPTPRQRLKVYLQSHPNTTRGEAAAFLQGLSVNGKPVCSQSWAYELAGELVVQKS